MDGRFKTMWNWKVKSEKHPKHLSNLSLIHSLTHSYTHTHTHSLSLSHSLKVFFSNPASTTRRANGMVRASIDGGRTWPRSLRVTQAAFAYSCLALVPQRGQLGLLWETSMDPSVCVGESCQTVFSSFDMDF